MRVSLLTIWHVKNYGAELQTYATVRLLQELGHTVEVVDYRLFDDIKPLTLRNKVAWFLNLVSPQNLKFELFWKRHIPSSRTYRSLQDLINDPPKADIYLVGSDQVWNPEIVKEKFLTYFLPFGPSYLRRASYASSLGGSDLNSVSHAFDNVYNQLNKFFSISCRESSGTKLLSSLLNRQVDTVLDPTLLFYNFHDLVSTNKEFFTLAYYELSPSPDMLSFARRVADKMNLKFCDVNKKSYLLGKLEWNRKSLQSWIYSIATSKFVITHSFHGLVLCLLYHRQFMVVYNDDRRICRIKDLLSSVGLVDRLFTSIDEAEMSEIWNKEIDYKVVDSKLDSLRLASRQYLDKILTL